MAAFKYCKDVPVKEKYDVIVCGGGPAGFCAAIQAARAGAKTAIVEQTSGLGGVLTTGGNEAAALFYSEGRQIIAGIGWEALTRLAKQGWASIPDFGEYRDHSVLGVNVNELMMMHLMDTMCEEDHVDLYLLQPVIDTVVSAEDPRRLQGVLIRTKAGPQMLEGSVIVDCTGDGDVCAFAGAAYELGGKNELDLQPGTLRFYLNDFRIEDIDQADTDEKFRAAQKTGELTRNDYWPAGGSPYEIFRNNGSNINHVTQFNSADSDSSTKAQIEGRKSVARIMNWARKSVKGAEHVSAVVCSAGVAPRESRRILCDHYITVQEYLHAVVYEDAVSYTYYPVDLHGADDDSLYNIFLSEGHIPTIPLGALRVKGFDNLLVAGRCISGDRLANSAFRVKASCMGMGQAAGALAALAAKENCGVRDVPFGSVTDLLKDHGAIVPEQPK